MSLYDEDPQYPNRLYDSETGRSQPTAYVDLIDTEAAEAISRADALQSMRDSTGFKVLEQFLTEQIDSTKDSLPYQNDHSKMLRLQEMVKCYKNVLDYIEHQIRVGSFHKQRDNQES